MSGRVHMMFSAVIWNATHQIFWIDRKHNACEMKEYLPDNRFQVFLYSLKIENNGFSDFSWDMKREYGPVKEW